MAIARHKTRQRELREARALVRRVQRGDSRAFELLYATYEGRIYRFCHRLTGRDETAAALVELTFARALASLPEDGVGQLDVPAYLYATASALAYERSGEPLGSRGLADGEVAVANDRLTPQERALLALRDLEDRPDDEIAAALAVDEAEVSGLVGAARLRLLAELRPPGAGEPCAGRLPDLSAHADGTLPSERRAALEEHIASCAACRATLFALREAALRYRSLPVPEPPGELGSRIGRALGLVGLPARAAAAEPVAAGGRQTVAAVAMGALAIVGVGITIAAAHDGNGSGKQTPAPKPAPAPASPQPAALPDPPASGLQPASGVARVVATRPHRPLPALHHVRAGARRIPPHSPRRNPALQGLGKSFAPESPPASAPPPPPPATPVTTKKPERQIPVEIVPPAAPSQAQAASNDPPPSQADAPATGPPPPPQTTTT